MKQLDIGGFVLVEVPADTRKFKMRATIYCENGSISFYNKFNNKETIILIPPGNYQIVGLAKDLTPDQWCEIFGTEYDAHCFMKQNKLLHETTLIIKKML